MVIAHAQGVRVKRVTLDQAEARAGHHLFDAATTRECGTPVESAHISIAGRIQDHHDDEALGIVRLDEHYEGGFHHDVEGFKFWTFRAAGADRDRAAEMVARLMRETTDMLNAHDATWRSLVDALLQRGSLDEPEILAVLGP